MPQTARDADLAPLLPSLLAFSPVQTQCPPIAGSGCPEVVSQLKSEEKKSMKF